MKQIETNLSIIKILYLNIILFNIISLKSLILSIDYSQICIRNSNWVFVCLHATSEKVKSQGKRQIFNFFSENFWKYSLSHVWFRVKYCGRPNILVASWFYWNSSSSCRGKVKDWISLLRKLILSYYFVQASKSEPVFRYSIIVVQVF